MVPMRFSSAIRRMVSAGTDKTSRKVNVPVMPLMSGADEPPPSRHSMRFAR